MLANVSFQAAVAFSKEGALLVESMTAARVDLLVTVGLCAEQTNSKKLHLTGNFRRLVH